MQFQQQLLITNEVISPEEPSIDFEALPTKTNQAIQRYLNVGVNLLDIRVDVLTSFHV